MDASGLSSVDTPRVVAFARANGVVWPSSSGTRAPLDGSAANDGAQARPQSGQSFPQPAARPAQSGLVVRSDAAYLTQSLAQESGDAASANPASSARTAADAYARSTAAAGQSASGAAATVEILTALPRLDSGRAVDLTV